MRATSRTMGVSINTVSKLLVDAGNLCHEIHDKNVRNVPSRAIQAAQTWSFTYTKKPKSAKGNPASRIGDCWLWTGIDATSKLIISFVAGIQDASLTLRFMSDLSSRISGRIQLTTAAYSGSDEAVRIAFGDNIDYAQIQKAYREVHGASFYNPGKLTGSHVTPVQGSPSQAFASTSYAERFSLSLRTGISRYARLSTAFSKSFTNHCHMLAIYTFYYNWIRIHKTIGVTPAMESGLTDRIWAWEDLVI